MGISSFTRIDTVRWPGRQVCIVTVDGSEGSEVDADEVLSTVSRDTDILDAMVVRSDGMDPEGILGIHRLIRSIRPKGLPVIVETSGESPYSLDDLMGAGYATGIGLVLDSPPDSDQRMSIEFAIDEGGTFDVIVVLDPVRMSQEDVLEIADSVEGYGTFILRTPPKPAPCYKKKDLDALAKSLRGRARNVRVG